MRATSQNHGNYFPACFRLGLVFLLLALRAHAQEIFLHSDWVAPVAAPAAAVWAGGNESSGTTNDAPHANGICLAESAIGQITAQSAGYPNAANDLAQQANNNLTAGNAYQNASVPGESSAPQIALELVFPGGFDPGTGSNYGAGVTSTYVTNDLAQADYDLRALLEVNPANASAAQQLVLLVDEQMLPLEWCGTEAMTFSTYARLNGLVQNNTNEETLDVTQARNYFQAACNVFDQFLANPYNSNLVEGQNPLVSSGVTNQVNQILDDYLRDLYAYAEASLTYFQLEQRANFYDPTVAGSSPPQWLLNDINSTVAEIQMRLVLASPFQNLPAYTAGTAGQITSILHDLTRLNQSVTLGRITFNTGASGDPTGDPTLDYGEFTTAFVPFFNNLDNPGNSTFDVAYNLAQTFATYAASLETDANSDVQNILQGQYEWASQQQSLQNQYLTQLQNLCGYVMATNGNTFPDIFTAALPPGNRDNLTTQFSTTGLQFNETGTIYEQWQTVESAETNLLLASIQLSNTFATIIEDSLVGNAIYSNQVRYAQLILTNGQQISAIDVQEGQVQAQAELATAQVNATTAESEDSSSTFGSIFSGVVNVASIALAPETGGASLLAAGALSTVEGGDGGDGGDDGDDDDDGADDGGGGVGQAVASGYDQASADLQIGSIQASEDKQIAALNAQIAQINANEQAQAEYVEANTTMLNLSAQLNALGLQANSQEVQIQLAAQQVDQEKSELANMMSQVSSLLNQWLRTANLVNQNPAFSDNLLLISDATVQQANDAYALAQEWAFLAALSLNYKDNCPDATSYVPAVLADRRSKDLLNTLNNMESEAVLNCQNSPYYTTVQFSVRNNFVQNNQTVGSGTNTVVTSYEPVLQGGLVLTNAAASQQVWTNYLFSNLITNEFGERVLVLNFNTSLTDQVIGGVQYNPLFSCETFGGTLYSGSDNNGNQLKGVQLSMIVSNSLSLPLGASDGFSVLLAQTGASALRNRGFGNVETSAGFRYFNFGYFAAGITASVNDLDGNGGTAAFQDRSPANGQWQLSINEFDSENNEALINNLGSLTDIQLQFSIRSYVDQIAAQHCTSP